MTSSYVEFSTILKFQLVFEKLAYNEKKEENFVRKNKNKIFFVLIYLNVEEIL